uniref:PDZ domain-containing protein n=1 Tax=Zonotrichia albicollis TaxID=44394 RepID=A0A8D2MR00_ZONAL
CLSSPVSQLALSRSISLGDPTKPQRNSTSILKEDKETFGFEIQTVRFPHQNDFSLEVCTCVCRIQEESPAHRSGLQTGDILTCINGVNVEGFGHKQIVDLIKSSGNYLRLETVNGAFFLRKMELETKLRALKVMGLIVCSPVKRRWLWLTADGGSGCPWDRGSWQGLTPLGSLLPAPPATPALVPLMLFYGNQE